MKSIVVACLVFFITLTSAVAQSSLQKASQPHFDHTTIYVTDLNRSADFYKTVLQLPEIPEPFHDGRHVWLRAGEHSQIHIVQGAKEDTEHDINIHLAFSVESMDAFAKHLDSVKAVYGNWAKESKKVQDRPDGVKQIYLKDPDGYWIEINDDKF